MTVAVCVAGVTGWAGRAVAEAVQATDDLRLTAGVSRSAAGQDLGRHWNGVPNGVPILGTVGEALDKADVLIDYTSHEAVREPTLAAIGAGVRVTSTSWQYLVPSTSFWTPTRTTHGNGVLRPWIGECWRQPCATRTDLRRDHQPIGAHEVRPESGTRCACYR
jgi:N-acetyl-gamma-glutamylphosphate reductase